ncbi:hypothetical protein HanIR_Chr05g0230061 [Helianthus annuus]|nr:hypothetical protein HanIR_Chr05g0230061 [Helianthus annuus]
MSQIHLACLTVEFFSSAQQLMRPKRVGDLIDMTFLINQESIPPGIKILPRVLYGLCFFFFIKWVVSGFFFFFFFISPIYIYNKGRKQTC